MTVDKEFVNMIIDHESWIWLGDMGVQKVYLGNDLIYQRQAPWFVIELCSSEE